MKYSVIIPIYNVEKYLNQTIDSIINQKRKDVEIVLVNDGSKDRSLDICKSYSKKFENVVVVDKDNSGVMDTWIEGVRSSSGEYICFLDSDDWLSNDYFNSLDEFVEKEYDLIAFDFVRCFSDGKKEKAKVYSIPYGELPKEELSRIKKEIFSDESKFSFYRWDKIVKSTIIKKCIDEIEIRSTSFEDCIIGYLDLLNIDSMYYLEKCLYNYRMRASSVTHKYNPKVFDENIMVKNELIRIAKKYDISQNQIRKIELLFIFYNVRWQLKTGVINKQYQISIKDIKETFIKKRKLILYLYKYKLIKLYNLIYGFKVRKEEKNRGKLYE